MPPSLTPTFYRRLPFFYGWVVIGVAFLTMAIGVNMRTAFSLLFPPILDEFGWDRAATAAAFSVGFLAATLYTPFIGTMMDRIGPRLVIPAGALLVAAGLALATWITTPLQLHLTLGVLVVGGSVTMTYIGHSAFLPHWFVRRRGIAIGIAFSGVGVGSILLFPWLQQQIVTVGWRSASLTMALLLVVLVVPINLLAQRGRPQDLGLTADGDPPQHDGSAPSRHPETIVDKAWAATEWTLPKALATRRFWWLCLGYFCGLMVWYSVQVHQTRYLLELGLGSEAAALALGLVGFSSIGGLIFVGHLSDRIGREWAWTLAYAGFAASYALLLVLPQVPSPALAYTMAVLQGGLGYGMAAVFGAIPAEIFEGKRFGTIYGVISLAGGLGAGAGPWLTGLVYDATGSYDGAFWLMLVAAAVSAGSVWMASPRKVRLVAGQAARRAHRHGA